MLGLSDRESVLSSEIFVRGLPRASGFVTDGIGGFLAGSVPRMESFKDDREAGMKRNVRGNPDGLVLLEEEGESRDRRSGKEDSSFMALWECGGEPESEMTTELVRGRV